MCVTNAQFTVYIRTVQGIRSNMTISVGMQRDPADQQDTSLGFFGYEHRIKPNMFIFFKGNEVQPMDTGVTCLFFKQTHVIIYI